MNSRASGIRHALDRYIAGRRSDLIEANITPISPETGDLGQDIQPRYRPDAAHPLTDAPCRVTTADASQPPFSQPQDAVINCPQRDTEDHEPVNTSPVTLTLQADLSVFRRAYESSVGLDPMWRFFLLSQAVEQGCCDVEVDERQYGALVRVIWRVDRAQRP